MFKNVRKIRASHYLCWRSKKNIRMKLYKNILFVLLLLPLAFIQAQSRHKIPSEKPKLVVGIVVEQMRFDYISRYWEKFSEKGFQRLINEGSVCRNARYQYQFNGTAPGMATLSTGTQPGMHGIIDNEWFDRAEDEVAFCVDDKKAFCVGGNEMSGFCSPQQMISSTVGDELKLSNFGKSKVIAVSLEPEGAVLAGGHNANAAYWFDSYTGNFVTTDYYMDSLPLWVNDFNEKKFPATYMENNWEMLKPAGEYEASLPDRNNYEKGIKKNEVNFPYELAKLKKQYPYFSLMKTTPFGNLLAKDFAVNAVVNEELGKDDFTDMLYLTFSATEEIGNKFGPLSVETQDAYLRLDAELGHLLDFLDDYLGKENVLVYLTSDHGTAYPVDYMKEKKVPAGEFNPAPAISLLTSYLRVLYGKGNWITHYQKGQIYLNRNLIEDSKIPLDEIQSKVAQFFIQFGGVSNVVEANRFTVADFNKGIFSKMQKGYNQKRSGDVIVSLLPGWVEKTDKVTVAHSAYNYDAHVPLVWYGWKMKRNTISRPVDLADVAPSISLFLNISYPNAATGNPIFELVE